MPIDFTSVVPILRIFNIDKAKEFYQDYLGFSQDWEHRYSPDLPLYQQISRENLIIHLSEHHGDGSPGANIRVMMSGIEEYHKELGGKGYRYMRPGLEDTEHGTRELGVVDPFGNRITFVERKEK
jgi:catechol 2,3-dioxygenase-like lactoylglutathione lyase family enzyme